MLEEISHPEPVQPAPSEPSAPAVDPGLRQRLHRHKRRIQAMVVVPIALAALYAVLFVARLDRYAPGVASRLPWPVAVVDGTVVWYGEFQDELDTFRRVAEGDPTAAGATFESAALERLVEISLVRKALQDNGLGVEDEAVETQVQTMQAQFGTAEALEEYLKETYGWDLADFRQRMVRPYLERFKILEYLNQDPAATVAAKTLAQDVKDKLDSRQISFEEAAREYSADVSTAEQGGSLGWFTWGTMVPAFESALRSLQVGEISGPVQTDFGVHLIRLDGLDDSGTGDEEGTVQASHILFQVADFPDWLARARKDATVVRLLPIRS